MVGGALDTKELEMKEVNKGEPFGAGVSRDELEEETSFESAVSAEDDNEKEEIASELSEQKLEPDLLCDSFQMIILQIQRMFLNHMRK